jgi:hypothetical protein
MSVILNKAYFNLAGDFQTEPSIIDKVSGGSNLTSIIQGISPQPSDFNAQITITNEFGKNVGWIDISTNGSTEVPSGTYIGETWNIWEYGFQQNVLAEVTRLSASKLYYQFRWREQDTEYIGALSTTTIFDSVGYETTISGEIIAEYGTGTDGEWVLVTDANLDTRSFESNGSTWSDLGYAKAIYPNIYTSELKDIPVTPTVVASDSTLTNSELVIIIAWLTALGESVADLEDEILLKMNIADYDTEGTATDSVKFARNVGTASGGSVTYAEVQQIVDWMNQSLLTTDDVEFNSVTTNNGNVDTNLDLKEDKANKVTSMSGASTDTEYPSAKAVHDELDLKEDLSNKVTSVSGASTDDQYPTAKLLNTELDLIDTQLDAQEFVKTGWPVDITSIVDISTSGTTFTLTINSDTEYYIDNVKYEISAGAYNVAFTNTTGTKYIYFVGLTLTASDTAWDIRSADKALVAEVYYNATGAYSTNVAYEFHSYEMSPVDHYHGHFTDATTVVNGLAVSQTTGAETVDVTQGTLMDEDITIQILTGTLGSAKFTQPLAPLQAYKYYRLGTGDIYREEFNSNVGLFQGGNIKVNPFSGSTYSLVDIQNNRYGAYWVVYTTDVTAPVQLWVGQVDSATLNDALEENGLDSMNFGSIPVAEIRVAYRVIVQRSGGSYTIEQIDNYITDPTTGIPTNPATAHGSLSGLTEDDHTQYYNETRLDAYKVSDIDPDLLTKIDKDLSNDTTYIPLIASSADGLEQAYLYDVTNDMYRKMTLDEVAAYANTATGSFVASSDYSGDGLGANKTAFTTLHQSTLNTGAQFYIDIKAPVTDQIIYVQVPTITSTDNAEFGTDGSTGLYYEIKLDTQNINGDVISDKIIKLRYDGTDWIYFEQSELTNETIPYIGANVSVRVPLNGVEATIGQRTVTPLEQEYGRDLVQVVENGDFVSGVITPFTSTNIGTPTVTDGIASFTATATNGNLKQILPTLTGSVLYSAKIKTDSNQVGISQYTSVAQANHSGSGEWETVSVVLSIAQPVIVIIDTRTSGWTEIQVKDIIAIPLPSDITTVAEMEARLTGEYFEGIDWVGKPRTYTPSEYSIAIQKYLADSGVESGDTIQGVYYVSHGNNIFNKLDYQEDTLINSTGGGGAGTYSTVTGTYSTGGMRVVVGQSYTVSGGNRNIWRIEDIDGNNITPTTPVGGNDTATYLMPDGAYKAYVYFTNDIDTYPLDGIMLNTGTTALDYEAYETLPMHMPYELHDLPNGVYDDIKTQRTKGGYELQASDITALTISLTNVDLVRIENQSDQVNGTDIGVDGNQYFDDQPLPEWDNSISVDTTDAIGYYYTDSNNRTWVVVAKSTYANLAEAQADLTGTWINYELETELPRLEDNSNNNYEEISGQLLIATHGTIFRSGSGVLDRFYATTSINTKSQVQANTGAIIDLSKDVSRNSVVVENLAPRVETNETKSETNETDITTINDDLDYASTTLDLTNTVLTPLITRINKIKRIYDIVTVTYAMTSSQTVTYSDGDIIGDIPTGFTPYNGASFNNAPLLYCGSQEDLEPIKIQINSSGQITFAESSSYTGLHELYLSVTYING